MRIGTTQASGYSQQLHQLYNLLFCGISVSFGTIFHVEKNIFGSMCCSTGLLHVDKAWKLGFIGLHPPWNVKKETKKTINTKFCNCYRAKQRKKDNTM